MLRNLSTLLVVLGLLLAAPFPAHAQYQQRAYAPENLRTLSRSDQERVINQEYSEQTGNRRIPDDQLRFYLDQVNRSNWTFSRIRQDIATSLRGNGGGWNQAPGYGNSVLCGSEDNRRKTCNTGFRGRATLSENLSKTRCVEGQNWGSGNGVVWVDRGCRGRFVQGRGGIGSSAPVTCGSVDNRYNECRTGFRNAVLSRKLSDARCTEGDTWGQRNGTVWVNRGCRAEFVEGSGNWNGGNSGYGNGNWTGNNSGYNVTCSSVNGRRASCAWNSRYGRPELLQQLSSDSCREGDSWGFAGNQIWVDRGCRARFGAR
ncbi:DUF3011 domain-containing protein [Pseudoxanthomonas gei]|uniref:DUF3011 domain-containing protein n=1 Tax=Pseudoxanthomonas gei TaxID=1383030 RepID=A0ABX0A9E9_9GAMM|nr:DUF3011 domain-containing protein [Pseudoxanthomonas gei]NDK38106.1 DUF3011 domain-containing protein [Pseudoxanthomonas gei]